jgi:hypothetical protein
LVLQGVTSKSSSTSSSGRALAGTIGSNFQHSSGSGGSTGSSSVVKGPKRAAGLGDASPKAQQLLGVLQRFMEEHVYPAEHTLEEHAGGDKRYGCVRLRRLRQLSVLGLCCGMEHTCSKGSCQRTLAMRGCDTVGRTC